MNDTSRVLRAIASTFLGFGLFFGGSSALWPDVLDSFAVSERTFGLLSGFSLALAFPILLFGDRVAGFVSNAVLLTIGLVMLIAAALGFGFIGGPVAAFALYMLLRGTGVAVLDLSVNALAMEAERTSGKHVMGPLHGGFSAGIIAATALSALALGVDLSFKWVYGGIAVTLVGCILYAWPLHKLTLANVKREPAERGRLKDILHPILRKAAVILAIAFAGEVIIVEWFALYLTHNRGASHSVGAIALGVFGSSMLLGRVANGLLLRRFGVRNAIGILGLVTMIGGIVIVVGGPIWVAILGGAIAGVGLAGAGPTALSVAGLALPDRASSAAGLSLAGGYLGMVVAPVVGGLLAGWFSTRATLMIVIFVGLALILAASRLPRMLSYEAPSESAISLA